MIKDNPLYQEHEAAKGAQWAKDELAKRALVEVAGLPSRVERALSDFATAQKRADIPALYGEDFNPGNWFSGHVSLDTVVVAFVTLDGAYGDVINDTVAYWTSQNSTDENGKKGREIKSGKPFDFWVRQSKRANGGRFTYAGTFTYVSHEGTKPMRVTFVRVNASDQ